MRIGYPATTRVGRRLRHAAPHEADVGARAAHVERHRHREPARARHFRRGAHATCGTRQQQRDRQVRRVGDGHEPARRRHHEQFASATSYDAHGGRPAHRPQPGVRDRRDHALVLAELGRHLGGARHVEPRAREHRGDRALVRRGRDRRAGGTPRPRRLVGIDGTPPVERLELATGRVEPPPTSKRSSRSHERLPAGRRAGRTATAAPGARSRSRRRSRGWSRARPGRPARSSSALVATVVPCASTRARSAVTPRARAAPRRRDRRASTAPSRSGRRRPRDR